MELTERIREAPELIRYHKKLLKDLHRRKQSRQAEILLKRYEKVTLRAIRDLMPSRFGVLWLLSGRKRKCRAYAAFLYLSDSAGIGLGPEAEAVLNEK